MQHLFLIFVKEVHKMAISLGIESIFSRTSNEDYLKNNEDVLVKECLKGKNIAQKVLYETHYKRMLGICYRYATNDLEAEDMLHEGFLKVFDKLDKFKQESKLSTWITRVITNNCIDILRKNKRDKLDFREDLPEVVDTPEFEEEEIAEFSCENLIEMMQDLPTGYRTVLMLYSIDGYTHEEIADKLKITAVTSRSQLSRARQMFRKIIEERRANRV